MSSKSPARSAFRCYTECLVILIFSFALTGASKPDRGASTPEDVYASFETALKTKDLRVFMRVCGKPLANFSPGLSCGSLLNEAWYSGRAYSKISVRTNGTGKAVIEIRSTKGNENLALFFLLEKEKSDLWVLKNINDNRTWSDKHVQ